MRRKSSRFVREERAAIEKRAHAEREATLEGVRALRTELAELRALLETRPR